MRNDLARSTTAGLSRWMMEHQEARGSDWVEGQVGRDG